MLHTISEPHRAIRPVDSDIAAAVRLLERAVQATGEAHVTSEETRHDSLSAYTSKTARADREAKRAGAMMDRLARIAEYVEGADSTTIPRARL